MRFKTLAIASALATTLVMPVLAQAQTEIQWWHSMDGALNDWVNDLAKQFNESQKDYTPALPPSAPATHRTSCRCSKWAPPP